MTQRGEMSCGGSCQCVGDTQENVDTFDANDGMPKSAGMPDGDFCELFFTWSRGGPQGCTLSLSFFQVFINFVYTAGCGGRKRRNERGRYRRKVYFILLFAGDSTGISATPEGL